MIRAIVAMDGNRGIANEHGIPWDLPSDRKHFFSMLTHGTNIIMGFNTYERFTKPLRNRRNYVWCRPGTALRMGFEPVYDLNTFLDSFTEDMWIIGGGGLYAAAISHCTELYITQLVGDLNCTVFFPPFTTNFQLASQTGPQQENDITYTYQTWQANIA